MCVSVVGAVSATPAAHEADETAVETTEKRACTFSVALSQMDDEEWEEDAVKVEKPMSADMEAVERARREAQAAMAQVRA